MVGLSICGRGSTDEILYLFLESIVTKEKRKKGLGKLIPVTGKGNGRGVFRLCLEDRRRGK